MSVLKEILENLAEYMANHPEFKDYSDLEFYFHEAEMNGNTEVPSMCFQLVYNDDNREKKTNNRDCREFFRGMKIELHTRTIDHSTLQDELWNFEETLFKVFSNIAFENIHPNLHDVKYVGTNPIAHIYWQPFKDEKEEEWFSNCITVLYELDYTI